MSQADFLVVAELYSLLAKFPSESIAAAALRPGLSANIRSALKFLYNEALATSGVDEVHSVPKASEHRPGIGTTRSTAELSPRVSEQVLRILLDVSRFPTKRELLELAEGLKLPIELRAKDDREAAARKIWRAAMQERHTFEELARILKLSSRTQTEGWFDLIAGDDK